MFIQIVSLISPKSFIFKTVRLCISKCIKYLRLSALADFIKTLRLSASACISKFSHLFTFGGILKSLRLSASACFLFCRSHKLIVGLSFLTVLGLAYGLALPRYLFSNPHSLVMLSNNGTLLGARIADDGQWRFPMEKNVPDKFEKCILAFEDKRFYSHPGVDVMAIGRAAWGNLKHHKRISGASTISMQVIRLSRNHPPRTIVEKITEMILATRLEIRYSKKEIMALYAANAPFGGNVVGLEAAAWRYYGKSADKLSWGEMASLSVLPNSPTLVHPGRNRDILKTKRDFVLWKLKLNGKIDSLTCMSAEKEPLPGKPYNLPSYAPHLLERMFADNKKAGKDQEVEKSTVNFHLQEVANNAIANHFGELSGNGIRNAAALIIDVKTGDILAYTGNTNAPGLPEYATDVDNVSAPRSTGSILKPLLYASLLQDGTILPDMLISDIPTNLNGYTPKNYNYDYDGAVPASLALSRSLNIPAVRMLQMYSVQNFAHQLNRMGFTTINKPGNYYGLTLILGGGEATLWDLAGVYASMSRTLTHYNTKGMYLASDFRQATYYKSKNHINNTNEPYIKNAPVLNASSIWLSFEAMVKVARPDEEKFWNNFEGTHKIAWKTGTSFGNRDAWAIGCTPDYVVAVWAGNSSGEGRPGLTGIGSAAPILFDIFNALPSKSPWFARPDADMAKVMICKQSGHLASDICPDKIEQYVTKNGVNSRPCPYHQYVFMDYNKKYLVQSDCECVSNMLKTPWFVLPPAEEAYYKLRHADYVQLPPYRKDCGNMATITKNNKSMVLVYPQRESKILLPVNLEGKTVSTVFEATHRNTSATVFWHIDDTYLGSTNSGMHQMAIAPHPGKHVLTLVDNTGEKLVQRFEIVNNTKR
jgi:penicillin-binding protein 1C